MSLGEIRVDIAAGGASSRLRPTLLELGYPPNYPKHLLPTGNPGGETLLGRIVRQGIDTLPASQPVIHASRENTGFIEAHPDIDGRTLITIGNDPSAFAPFMRTLMHSNRTLGASGDHYADTFNWTTLLDHHESSRFPITFVAGQCSEVDEGAVFDIADDGKIERFHRPDRTDSESLINIGLYVFDPARAVMQSLERVGVSSDNFDFAVTVKADVIVSRLIADDLVGAYVLPPFSSFNVNTAETYEGLRQHTAAAASL